MAKNMRFLGSDCRGMDGKESCENCARSDGSCLRPGYHYIRSAMATCHEVWRAQVAPAVRVWSPVCPIFEDPARAYSLLRKTAGLHADRAARGDRHHRPPARLAAPRCPKGPGGRGTYSVRQQPQTDRN